VKVVFTRSLPPAEVPAVDPPQRPTSISPCSLSSASSTATVPRAFCVGIARVSASTARSGCMPRILLPWSALRSTNGPSGRSPHLPFERYPAQGPPADLLEQGHPQGARRQPPLPHEIQPLLPPKPQALRCHNTSHQKACTTSQLRYSASDRYGLYSSRTRSTPWAGHRTAWKRCPHLLRLSPLSKAPPESKNPAERAEAIQYGRASSTWARLIAKPYGADHTGGSPGPAGLRIGGGAAHWLAPLPPPNRTGGSPASGSPVRG